MSSPQMTRMLGFFACASASEAASETNAIANKDTVRLRIQRCAVDTPSIDHLLFLVSVDARVGLCSRACGLNAAKAEMIAAGGDLALTTRADHVAGAVLVRAKERAAAMNALLLRRFSRIERRFRTLRVFGHTTGAGQLRVGVGPIPVGAPLPDVSRHIEEAVGI